MKLYELKIVFEKLRQLDGNFFMFQTFEIFLNAIKTCIQSESYSVSYSEEDNAVIFEIKNVLFVNGGAKIKIPEQKQSLESQVESLTKTVSELRKEIQNLKKNGLDKDEAAIKSFQNISF